MKKLLFTILVMMATCTTLSARIAGFGITAGVNLSQETGGTVARETADGSYVFDSWTLDAKRGWYAGLQFKLTLPVTGLGLDLAVTYSHNEATLRMSEHSTKPVAGDGDLSEGVGGSHSDELTQTGECGFITVPLHLRWDIQIPLISRLVVPYLFTGPQASYSIKKLDEDMNTRWNDMEFNTKNLLWKYDVGGGIILLRHLQVSYAYEFPISDASSFQIMTENISGDSKKGTHRVGLTYFF